MNDSAEKEKGSNSNIVAQCSFCKYVRDDKGNWNKLNGSETLRDIHFSHSICSICAKKHYAFLNIFHDDS